MAIKEYEYNVSKNPRDKYNKPLVTKAQAKISIWEKTAVDH
jgi:hypothetical protein